MKKLARDNVRSAKSNKQQTKINQSQSPPHNKLLKKIQQTYKEGVKKHDFSLQDNYVRPEKKEEAQDFRIEIEKRFQKSISNKDYIFPFHKNSDDSGSETESSFSSLQHVTVYDLASQNQKQKSSSNAIIIKPKEFQSSSQIQRTEQSDISDNISEQDFKDENDSEVPIELRIRDKSSSTYRKLIRLLEKNPMFSHNSTNTYMKQFDKHNYVNTEENQNHEEDGFDETHKYITHSYQNVKQEMLTNFTTQVSTTDTQKGFTKDAHIQDGRPKLFERNVKSSEREEKSVKKTTSQGKMSKIESSSFLGKSPVIAGSKTNTYIDSEKMAQDSLKQLFNQNNSLNKSITPQYNQGKSNMKDVFSREGAFKTYNNDGIRPQTSAGKNQNSQIIKKNPLENLYQRAQKDVINSKVPISNGLSSINPANVKSYIAKNSRDGNQSHLNENYSTIAVKRDETPKDAKKQATFINLTEPSEQTLDRGSANSAANTKAKLSKKNSVKTLQVPSPTKKAKDRTFYTSYDFSQAQFFQKPVSKLDLSKRDQGHNREALSSSRHRNKTPEKASVERSQNIFMRTSYDINKNQSSVLNVSTQKNSSKASAAQQGIKKQNSFGRNIQSAKTNLNK